MDDKEAKLEELKKKHERKIRREENKEEKDKKDLMIKTLSENVQDLQNKLLYQQAEFENFKKRREDETRNLLKYQNFDIALEIITVVDSLERALSVPVEKLTDEVKKYLEGFRIMYNNLINILNKFEIHEVDCLNKEFDHNTCQALMTEHVDSIAPGIVIQVLQKGYVLKDKLLRPALVKVSE
jgi:molecular chaperone GrpE